MKNLFQDITKTKTVFSGRNLIVLLMITVTGCYSPKIITNKNFNPSTANVDSVISLVPDNGSSLATLKGEGKAIVSEPNNSHHVTLNFVSNRKKSLITIQNRLGIEGGKILSTEDSLVIYNRIDKYVRIVPVQQGSASRVNNLASVNLVDMMTLPVNWSETKQMLENKKMFLIILSNGAKVYIDKKDFRVQQIDQPRTSGLPYSRIIYDAYDSIKGFSIPRRITIFSADKSSKVSLLIQSLTVNPDVDKLTIEIPKDIPVYRK